MEKKTKGFYTTSSEPSVILSDLVPYSKYKMFIVVANNRFEGPPSNHVEFTTKEGGKHAAHWEKTLQGTHEKLMCPVAYPKRLKKGNL